MAFATRISWNEIPEIALFKWVHRRGLTEVQIKVFDPKTNPFVEKTTAAAGRAKSDDFTVLLLINFSVTDLDEPPTR